MDVRLYRQAAAAVSSRMYVLCVCDYLFFCVLIIAADAHFASAQNIKIHFAKIKNQFSLFSPSSLQRKTTAQQDTRATF